ncbi:MAG: hypothetical protein FWE21_09310 [Defluviitaleaceae bacterium]|nr:hypothetical protein [Defluviitaleaceae bacterium]
MNFWIPSIAIIATTALLIALAHFRHLCRQRQQIFTVHLPCFSINIHSARIFCFVTMRVIVIPEISGSTCPPIYFTLHKNSKPIMQIPNFWLNHSGFAIVRPSKANQITLDIKTKTSGKNTTYSFQMFDESLFN